MKNLEFSICRERDKLLNLKILRQKKNWGQIPITGEYSKLVLYIGISLAIYKMKLYFPLSIKTLIQCQKVSLYLFFFAEQQDKNLHK
jgi:hypothetical protein